MNKERGHAKRKTYFRDQKQNGFLIPPVERFLENHERYHFGGTCFTLNGHLAQLLRALGFPAELIQLGEDHMAILTRLPEYAQERLYVDVGAAAPLFRPVRFECEDLATSQFGSDAVRIERDSEEPGRYRFVRYRQGKMTSNDWSFRPEQTKAFHEFQPIIERMNQPGSFFLTSLRCQIWQSGQKRTVSLVNNVFTIRTAAGDEQKTFCKSKAEIEAVLAEEFHLPPLAGATGAGCPGRPRR